MRVSVSTQTRGPSLRDGASGCRPPTAIRQREESRGNRPCSERGREEDLYRGLEFSAPRTPNGVESIALHSVKVANPPSIPFGYPD
jgi:hypothetical protein